MPRTQVANVGTYGFGAGVTENAPLTFSVRRGGRLSVRVENQNEPLTGPISVTLQVSADGSSWTDTAATPNGTAVADVSIPARQYREWQINLRQGQDNFFRLQAAGGGRGEAQIRGDEILQLKTI